MEENQHTDLIKRVQHLLQSPVQNGQSLAYKSSNFLKLKYLYKRQKNTVWTVERIICSPKRATNQRVCFRGTDF